MGVDGDVEVVLDGTLLSEGAPTPGPTTTPGALPPTGGIGRSPGSGGVEAVALLALGGLALAMAGGSLLFRWTRRG